MVQARSKTEKHEIAKWFRSHAFFQQMPPHQEARLAEIMACQLFEEHHTIKNNTDTLEECYSPAQLSMYDAQPVFYVIMSGTVEQFYFNNDSAGPVLSSVHSRSLVAGDSFYTGGLYSYDYDGGDPRDARVRVSGGGAKGRVNAKPLSKEPSLPASSSSASDELRAIISQLRVVVKSDNAVMCVATRKQYREQVFPYTQNMLMCPSFTIRMHREYFSPPGSVSARVVEPYKSKSKLFDGGARDDDAAKIIVDEIRRFEFFRGIPGHIVQEMLPYLQLEHYYENDFVFYRGAETNVRGVGVMSRGVRILGIRRGGPAGVALTVLASHFPPCISLLFTKQMLIGVCAVRS